MKIDFSTQAPVCFLVLFLFCISKPLWVGCLFVDLLIKSKQQEASEISNLCPFCPVKLFTTSTSSAFLISQKSENKIHSTKSSVGMRFTVSTARELINKTSQKYLRAEEPSLLRVSNFNIKQNHPPSYTKHKFSFFCASLPPLWIVFLLSRVVFVASLSLLLIIFPFAKN